jgi:multiple sugar transport system ATP-binding protein
MHGVPPHDRDVAMVFQSGALFPHMTVRENIAFGLKLRKVPAAERESRIKEATDALHLENCLSRFPTDLSTGQRQRVALARAMVRRPKIFLLDEPLANLDAPMRVELRSEIARLRSLLKATMIYVTHDQAEALSLGQRVALLRAGKLEQVAEPTALYASPANMFVAQFIGSPQMNLVPGTLVREDDSLTFLETAEHRPFRIPLTPAQEKQLQAYTIRPVILGIRPENLAITSGGGIEATVERIDYTGADAYLQVRTSANTLMVRASAQVQTTPGSKLSIAPQPGGAHFFDPQTGARLNV